MLAKVFLVVLFCLALTKAYSSDTNFIALSRKILLDGTRLEDNQLTDLLAPKRSVHLDYGSVQNLFGHTATENYIADDDVYVKVEDFEHILDVTCSHHGGTNYTDVSLRFQDPEAFRMAKNLWRRDDLIFFVHDPSCDGLDRRSKYRPIEKTINNATQTVLLKSELMDVHPGHEASSILSISIGDTPPDLHGHLWPRFLNRYPYYRSLFPHAVPTKASMNHARRTDAGNIWGDITSKVGGEVSQITSDVASKITDNPVASCVEHAATCVESVGDQIGEELLKPLEKALEALANHQISLSVNRDMQPRAKIIDWTLPDLHVTCVDCIVKGGVTARSRLGIDLKLGHAVIDLVKGEWSDLPHDLIKEASLEIVASEAIDIALQLEIASSADLSVWCNFNIIGAGDGDLFSCGATYGAGGASFQSRNSGSGITSSANPLTKIDGIAMFGGRTSDRAADMGPGSGQFGVGQFGFGVALLQPRIGFWIGADISTNFNATSPGVRVQIAEGSRLALDLMAEDHFQHDLHPDISFKHGHFEAHKPKLTLSAAVGAGIGFSAGFNNPKSPNSNKTLNVGGRFDLARVDLTFSEEEGVDDKCNPGGSTAKAFGFGVDFAIGVIAWFQIGPLFLNTNMIPNKPLYVQLPLFQKCVDCKGDCISNIINDAVSTLFSAFTGGSTSDWIPYGNHWDDAKAVDKDGEHSARDFIPGQRMRGDVDVQGDAIVLGGANGDSGASASAAEPTATDSSAIPYTGTSEVQYSSTSPFPGSTPATPFATGSAPVLTPAVPTQSSSAPVLTPAGPSVISSATVLDFPGTDWENIFTLPLVKSALSAEGLSVDWPSTESTLMWTTLWDNGTSTSLSAAGDVSPVVTSTHASSFAPSVVWMTMSSVFTSTVTYRDGSSVVTSNLTNSTVVTSSLTNSSAPSVVWTTVASVFTSTVTVPG